MIVLCVSQEIAGELYSYCWLDISANNKAPLCYLLVGRLLAGNQGSRFMTGIEV